MDGLFLADDNKPRCWWCQATPLYRLYHDTEWGFPVHDDRRLFEKLCLEGFQSGLSWLTILNKRENFRRAFCQFDYAKIARFTAKDVTRLLNDASIVRHRGKIEAVIHNAQRASDLASECGSLANYIWRYQPANRPSTITREWLLKQSTSEESKALSKDLKKRGWRFVGPTTVYAFMQAMGLVNDHLEGCHVRHLSPSQ
jgi:DNA-3-methyladenine glycosylase I